MLVLAMDHLISDGASVGTAWRDLWTLYAQSVQRLPFALANRSVQFPD